jgi:hypothetical protein
MKTLKKVIHSLVRVIAAEINIWSMSNSKMRLINRHIMSLPVKGVNPGEEVFNKHLQDLLWTFWFGKPLYMTTSTEVNRE